MTEPSTLSARNLKNDLVLPTLLFAALGAMSWAVRGSSGYGGSDGCIFAGVLWGTAWWFIAREPRAVQSRRYTSGWIILAMMVGFGISGNRGWAQWSSMFEGRLQTNTAAGEYVSILPVYGFVWLFIAGVPWAGIGACMLAWCGDAWKPRGSREWVIWCGKWVLRIGSGYAGVRLAQYLFVEYPNVFLPLYTLHEGRYNDLEANSNLGRMINDNRAAITHLGLYLGFLAFEFARRDWKNVLLIAAVGLINGVGWSVQQNWMWANELWPNVAFNWWRSWESCGGISIGVALGVAYFLVNRPVTDAERAKLGEQLTNRWPNLERFGAYFGLLIGVGFSIRNGLKGWANLYLGNEDYWSGVLWKIIGPLMILGFILMVLRILMRCVRVESTDDMDMVDAVDMRDTEAAAVQSKTHDQKSKMNLVFPHAYVITWLVLIIMNILAQLATKSFGHWPETVFAFYYAALFVFTGMIIRHYHKMKNASRE
ncbi:MAG: hypothetical protein SGI88_11765 [Candidatus Hydrogenedentes bacterium]|nr:hypothetical protein [Candidatus Hydrogenedentota bacterium]